MQARTQIGAAEIYFCYEDWQGNYRFRSYHEAKKALGNEIYLECYLYSHYYNSAERVNEILLKRKPTIKLIKQFIKDSIKCLTD